MKSILMFIGMCIVEALPKPKPKFRKLEEWEIVNAPYEMPPFTADLKAQQDG